MSHTFLVCVDGGGTRSRGRLIRADGRAVGEAVAGPCNPTTDRETAVASVTALWDQLARQAGIAPGDAGRHHLAIGTAGIAEPGTRRAFLDALPPFSARTAMTDGYAALIGAGGGRPCGLVVLGTGAVAHRLLPDGRSQLRDGWGFLAGDRGSGAWIGRKALRATLEATDGARPRSRLTETVGAVIGVGNAEILAWLKKVTTDRLAALAPLVIEAAGEDALAEAILDRAAGHAAALAGCLDVPGDEPLYLAGGLAPLLKARVEARIGRIFAAPANDAVHGAFLVATGRAPQETHS